VEVGLRTVDFPCISPYDNDADEFVRHGCRVQAGWRRDEWAYSPLFIWANFQVKNRQKLAEGLATDSGPCGCWERMAVKLDEIRSAAQRVAASHGLEVVDIEFIGPAKERTLRIYLEKNAEGRGELKAAIEAGLEGLPERLVEGTLSVEQLSGITHEDCAGFSRDFGVLLDVEELIPDAEYTLEASSPGLDRKLSKPEEFHRFAGCLVKVQTFEPIRNNRHWQGRLAAGAEAGKNITLDLNAVKQNSKTKKTGVSTVVIALDNIEKAQLVPEI
jgi:ribosome maturation factor RimP